MYRDYQQTTMAVEINYLNARKNKIMNLLNL